jgi:hypothetical protein
MAAPTVTSALRTPALDPQEEAMLGRHLSRRLAVSTVSITALTLGVVASTDPAGAHTVRHRHSVSISTVITGLGAPRGITFDNRGNMFVAESGVAGTGPAGLTHTGRVDKYRSGSLTRAWSTPFNSLYVSEDPTAPPDVLGPNGLSAVGNGCRSHHHRSNCPLVMITGESTPGVLAATGGAVNDPQAGHLYRFNRGTGTVVDRSDVGTQMYQWTGDHASLFPDDFPDSNPYGVLVTKDRHTGRTHTYVADAGANTISEIRRDGTARIIAYIPNETDFARRDATPTCIAEGPDGYLYVGALDFVSNLFVPPGTGGRSNVWRVDPHANYPTVPTVWASGLTTITACTFDRQGNFWATEMFAGGLEATPPGDIVRVRFHHPTSQRHFGFGRLPLPGGIAQGPDGAMYVTVGSAAPGASGAVVRVALRHHHRHD